MRAGHGHGPGGRLRRRLLIVDRCGLRCAHLLRRHLLCGHLLVGDGRSVVGARLRRARLLVVYRCGLIGVRLRRARLLVVYGRGLVGWRLRRAHMLVANRRGLISGRRRRAGLVVDRRRLVSPRDDRLPGPVAEHGFDETVAAVSRLPGIDELPTWIESLARRPSMGSK
jgi:hypothetical protein